MPKKTTGSLYFRQSCGETRMNIKNSSIEQLLSMRANCNSQLQLPENRPRKNRQSLSAKLQRINMEISNREKDKKILELQGLNRQKDLQISALLERNKKLEEVLKTQHAIICMKNSCISNPSNTTSNAQYVNINHNLPLSGNDQFQPNTPSQQISTSTIPLHAAITPPTTSDLNIQQEKQIPTNNFWRPFTEGSIDDQEIVVD